MALKDSQYLERGFKLSEQEHAYGNNVHILNSPFQEAILHKLCSVTTGQPEANDLVRKLTDYLLTQAVNYLFPREIQTIQSRMMAYHEEGQFEYQTISPKTKVVVVDLMRAGILPTLVCYEALHQVLPSKNIRQDHILLNRQVNEKGEVVGVHISGHKIGGSVENDSFVMIPDPMGATGGTIQSTIDLYLKELKSSPKKFIALHFIITPEYLRVLKNRSSQLEIFALRLDRGLSSDKVLKSALGQYWNEERGLNAHHYIVPGAGDVGKLLNNA